MHHVDWWVRDHGETNIDVLVTMCRFHHRLVHKRLVGIAKEPDGTFTFCRADGTPITTPSRQGDVAPVLMHEGIDETTAVPQWGGERLDLDLALTALFSWQRERRG